MTDVLFDRIRLIDGTGAAVRPASVLVTDGRIAAIDDPGAIPAGDGVEVVTGPDLTLLPGLVDAHVHLTINPDPLSPRPGPSHLPVRDDRYLAGRTLLFAADNARATLEAGITTVRDVAAPNDVIFALRDAIADGEIVGPRIAAAGEAITHTGGHGTEYGPGLARVADGADAVVAAVRRQVAAGADVIKFLGGTRPALSPPYRGAPGQTTPEMAAGTDEAHRAGIPVAVHAHSDLAGIHASIAAGVDSLEHGFPLDEQAADTMAEKGIVLCPTLSVVPGAQEAIDRGLWDYPGSEAQMSRMAAWAPAAVSLAHSRGVRIALGTDAAMPFVRHGDNAAELALLVAAGMSEMEALVAATSVSAGLLGIGDDVGTVEVGKEADLIVVDGDPLADIGVVAGGDRLEMVVQGGRIVLDRRPSVNGGG